jgi:16S rRNA (guanine(966)-N(2))-methyltransferase RsmD
MRILAGQFKGKRLSAGRDLSIRPITNRLKEIIFSVINDFVFEKKVLDLFSGSGSLGLEALSRGAGHVTFVEREISSIKILKRNIDALELDSDFIQIRKSDAQKFLTENGEKYGLILSDPPFKYSSLQLMVNKIFVNEFLELNGLLVVHHEIDNPLHFQDVPYLLLQQKKVGRSLLSFLVKEAGDV